MTSREGWDEGFVLRDWCAVLAATLETAMAGLRIRGVVRIELCCGPRCVTRALRTA